MAIGMLGGPTYEGPGGGGGGGGAAMSTWINRELLLHNNLPLKK